MKQHNPYEKVVPVGCKLIHSQFFGGLIYPVFPDFWVSSSFLSLNDLFIALTPVGAL